jgi:hypothetical protein
MEVQFAILRIPTASIPIAGKKAPFIIDVNPKYIDGPMNNIASP